MLGCASPSSMLSMSRPASRRARATSMWTWLTVQPSCTSIGSRNSTITRALCRPLNDSGLSSPEVEQPEAMSPHHVSTTTIALQVLPFMDAILLLPAQVVPDVWPRISVGSARRYAYISWVSRGAFYQHEAMLAES